MRRHRLDRRQRKKRKKIIIFSMAGIICFFSVGYATFTQNFLVSGKGTIVEAPITIDELKTKKVTSGDGLYEDITEEGRYIYKGANPDNYISFNNETWRIISVEADNTLKIIRNESIGAMEWDILNTRDSSTSTYCINASNYGCNAWAATTNLVNNPNEFTLYYPNGNFNSDTITYSGTVVQDSSLNTYLNEEYLETINENSKHITNHDFNVGTPGDRFDTEDIPTDVSQEALYKWNGKVGLINITDILRTTTNITCTSLNVGYNSSSTGYCNTNNWAWPDSGFVWTISPYVDSYHSYAWGVRSDGYVGGFRTDRSNGGIVPVLYLNREISLTGKGSKDRPYTIYNTN